MTLSRASRESDENCDRKARLKARAPENHRTKPRRALRDVVSLIFTSWNQMSGWLRQIAAVKRAA